MKPTEVAAARLGLQVGRTFLHPVVDYLLIGGILSVVAAAWLRLGGYVTEASVSASYDAFLAQLPFVILLCNSAHFAASTVRLYGKPGAFEEFPFITLGLPLVALLVVGVGVVAAPVAGPALQALYLTWSPYHYSAQAYGLTLMYAYRSGCAPDKGEAALLRAATLMPFFHFFLSVPRFGFEWLAPAWLVTHPQLGPVRSALVAALAVACVALPLLWWRRLASRGQRVPGISLAVLLSNASWWLVLTPIGAFAVATVAHSVQYLVIAAVFHAGDHAVVGASPGGSALRFYAVCVGLGYLLFNVWPYAYVSLGFGLAESMMMVIAVINIHHFVVDGYIWRLRRGGNRRIVVDGPQPAFA